MKNNIILSMNYLTQLYYEQPENRAEYDYMAGILLQKDYTENWYEIDWLGTLIEGEAE